MGSSLVQRSPTECLNKLTKPQNGHHVPVRKDAGVKGERIYSAYSFFTSVLDEVSCQRHATTALYARSWIGCWVSLRAGLDRGYRKNPLPMPGIEPRSSSL
jgi:hypothetical protein